ncbi:hypothetical protein HGM15179_005425 [Zosterops borbonicus]|uniref:Reverse transcriptase n=1 Tax=Zosterops borbonicus TaxID=364589 RepID=A0A8K1LPM4_9PASS|nr:hypothetical protein HGM15179_005425 [Zosterops borbonicus]
MDEGIECFISKFADDTKLGVCVDRLEDRRALQKDLEWLGRWAESKKMKFNESKCQVLHFGHDNPLQHYSLGTVWLDSAQEERDLGVLVTAAEHEPAVCPGGQEGQWHLAWIRNGVASRSRELILPLYSALAATDRTTGHSLKLHQGKYRLDIRKKFFTERVIKYWNSLPGEVVESPSLDVFKRKLDVVLDTMT